MAKRVDCKTGTTWNELEAMIADHKAKPGALPPLHEGVECNINASKTSIKVTTMRMLMVAFLSTCSIGQRDEPSTDGTNQH